MPRVRAANQNGDIPWTQYEPKTPRTRNSSLASIASFASVASISSVGRRLSNFWKPPTGSATAAALDTQRRQSIPVPTEPKYRHVPQHAAADHFKTTTTPQVRKASMCPPVPRAP